MKNYIVIARTAACPPQGVILKKGEVKPEDFFEVPQLASLLKGKFIAEHTGEVPAAPAAPAAPTAPVEPVAPVGPVVDDILTGVSTGTTDDLDPAKLMRKTLAELREIAVGKGLTVDAGMTKQQIVDLVTL